MYSRMVVPKEIFEFSIIIIANAEKRKYVNMHIYDLSKNVDFFVYNFSFPLFHHMYLKNLEFYMDGEDT